MHAKKLRRLIISIEERIKSRYKSGIWKTPIIIKGKCKVMPPIINI